MAAQNFYGNVQVAESKQKWDEKASNPLLPSVGSPLQGMYWQIKGETLWSFVTSWDG